MRRTAFLSCLALCAAGFAVPGPASHAASTVVSVALTGGGFAAIAVDETHHRVFVSHQTGGIDVVSQSGTLTQTLAAPAGARGLAMTNDGSRLVVALPQANAIAVLDAGTLTETARYSTGDGVCPQHVAVSGQVVWFGYHCGDTAASGIGRLDLGAETPVVTTHVLREPYASGVAPIVAVAAAAPHRLLVAEIRYPGALYVYDISEPTPLVVAHRSGEYAPSAASISADGAHVFSPLRTGVLSRLSGPDLVETAAYSHDTYWYAGASAPSPDGRYVAVAGHQEHPDYTDMLAVYAKPGASAINRVALRPRGNGVGAGFGLTWDPDSATIYAGLASGSATTGTTRLLIVRTANFAATSATLTGPSTAARTKPLRINGRLMFTGQTGVGVPRALSVSRTDLAGTKALPSVTTSSDGSFTFVDTPPVGGNNTYRVRYAGDATHAAATASRVVPVSRAATTMSISTDRTIYNYRDTVRVTVRLGPTYNSRRVLVYAQIRPGEPARGVYSGVTDAQGYVRFSAPGLMSTTFIAKFAGDHRYAPAQVSRRAPVRAKLDLAMATDWDSYYARSGVYHLYRGDARPRVLITMWHVGLSWNVPVEVQTWLDGAWRPLELQYATVGIGSDAPGTGYYTFPRQPVGRPTRFRVVFGGWVFNAAATSSWIYFRATS